MPGARDMGELVFRANPSYELVVFDRLAPGEKSALASLASDPDFYGVLRPGAPGLNLKSVNREVALLFCTLATPGKMPSYVRAELGASYEGFVMQLVLDQVLQLEHDSEFISGAGAQQLFLNGSEAHYPLSRISRLSQQAVQHAQRLEIDDASVLAARMYFYNREPASPYLVYEFPTEEELARRLGVLEETESGARMKRRWTEGTEDPENPGWRVWKNRHKRNGKAGLGYKLYVSPRTEVIVQAFAATVATFSETAVPQFKVGRDVYGIVRPDKLVAYFSTEQHMRETAARLNGRIAGMATHGVPFTCELYGEGLISWGMDPPRRTQVLPWQERQSWRLWVVNRLATALLAAKAQTSHAVEPWRFAIDRARLDGIETDSWTPSPDIFQCANET